MDNHNLITTVTNTMNVIAMLTRKLYFDVVYIGSHLITEWGLGRLVGHCIVTRRHSEIYQCEPSSRLYI